MKVKKIGHSCLLIDIDGDIILTDPGNLAATPVEAKNVCAVLISHEHAGHFHIDTLAKILADNPHAIVVTNDSVGKLLRERGIPYTKVEHDESEKVNGIVIEGYGMTHAHMDDTVAPVQNTSYLINNALYFPGDAYYNPGRDVEVLALPVAGPWLKISEALDFARLLKPAKAFPIHDADLVPAAIASTHVMIGDAAAQAGIEFVPLKTGEETELGSTRHAVELKERPRDGAA